MSSRDLTVVGAGEPAFPELWQTLSGRGLARAALYEPESLAYYEHLRPIEQVADLSFVVAMDKLGVIGLKMQAFQRGNGGMEVSCHGLPCLMGINADLSAEDRHLAYRTFKPALTTRLSGLGTIEELYYRDHLDDGSLSVFSHFLLGQGATCRPYLTQMIDLSLAESHLRALLSKTARWSINWGQKNLDLKILDGSSIKIDDMEAFRQLHVSAAGRETRPPESWHRQLEMVRSGAAFLALGWLEGELVTGAYFVTSKSHCYYGVSASNRDMFDKPLGHAIIWNALVHARDQLGVRFFELGEQVYQSMDAFTPSAKDLGISFFKRSFGGVAEAGFNIHLRDAALSPSPST